MLGVDNMLYSRDVCYPPANLSTNYNSQDCYWTGPWGYPNLAMPENCLRMNPSQMMGGVYAPYADSSTYGSGHGQMGVQANTSMSGETPHQAAEAVNISPVNTPGCDSDRERDADLPPVSPPPQRARFSYTRYQLEVLNCIYVKIRYPNSMQKQLVAKRVGITRDQVKIWFQNRRRKDVTKNVKPCDLPPTDSTARMVGDDVIVSILDELLKFDKDPKGKTLRQKLRNMGKRPTPYDRPAQAPIPRSVSPEADEYVPNLLPNNVPLTCPEPNLISFSQDAISGRDQQSTSPITLSPASSSEAPSSNPLDMASPPNAVAPVVDEVQGPVVSSPTSSEPLTSASSSTFKAELTSDLLTNSWAPYFQYPYLTQPFMHQQYSTTSSTTTARLPLS